jgi:hypothetical protein
LCAGTRENSIPTYELAQQSQIVFYDCMTTNRIATNPKIHGGKPIVKGTKIAIEHIKISSSPDRILTKIYISPISKTSPNETEMEIISPGLSIPNFFTKRSWTTERT